MLLSARPPTPPPSRSKDPATRIHLRSNTPDGPPSSTDTSANSSSNGTRKRVDFSPWTDEHQSAKLTPSSSVHESIKPLPPSRDCRSTKSILKNVVSSAQPQSTEADLRHDIVTMLDSVLLQLETADRSINIDAYANLCGTLKAYNDTPTTDALRARMGSLLKYIRRDVQSRSLDSGTADTLLVTHALKLLVFVIWNGRLTTLLTDEYRTFVVEQALQAVDDPSTPKAILLHYLHLLATQNFRPTIMTTSRTGRLLDSLQTVTDRVKGNGIVCERLMVYSRLLDQAELVMRSKTGWIEHLLSGMLLPTKDARSKAIAFGVKTAQLLGGRSTFSLAFQQSLDRQTSDKTIYSSLACRRLRNMVKSGEDTVQIPQIWSVVMLLQKGSKTRLDKWIHFKEWLMVIQLCFNCNDSATRIQANLAWNRLIYVLPPQESTDPAIIKMLVKPITSQLERPGSDKPGKGSRTYAMSSFYTLIYYALRPSGTSTSYDILWDAFISKTFSERYLSSLPNADYACRTMMAICWSAKSKVWRENRAIEASIIEPEELPVLDCKWLRSRSKKVTGIFQRLFNSASWGPGKPEQAFVGTAWKHFCSAMGDACRKEVKPSPDTLLCISSLLDLLQTIWNDRFGMEDTTNKASSEAFNSRIYFIIKCMVAEIGYIPFTEFLFCIDPSGSLIPQSCSPQQPRQKTISAAEAVLRIVCSLPPEFQTITKDQYLVEEVLQLFTEPRDTIPSITRFYSTCAVRAAAGKNESRSRENKQMWKSGAILMQKVFKDINFEKLQSHDAALESQFEDALGVLQAGLKMEQDIVPTWENLLSELLCLIEQRSGRMSILSLALEPLSSFALTLATNTTFGCTTCLLETFLATERWRDVSSILGSKPSSLLQRDEKLARSLRCLVSLIDRHLTICYETNNANDVIDLTRIVRPLTNFLAFTPTQTLRERIPQLEQSLSIWLKDPSRKFVSTSDIGTSMSTIARKICTSILESMGRLGKNGMPVHELENLFAAGLESTHELVINNTVAMLAETFGESSATNYPSRVQTALSRLDNVEYFDFSASELSPEIRAARLSEVLDSQEDGLTEENDGPFQKHSLGIPSVSSVHRPTESTSPFTPSHQRRRHPSSARIKPKPKLPHDDSQMDFAPIEPSAMALELDSQVLTENQKDVRERQRSEPATTFSDFRLRKALTADTSQSPSRSKSVPILVAGRMPLSIDEPSTPTSLGPHTDDMDDLMPSSPTPSSKSQELRLSEIDVPSSPPTGSDSVPGHDTKKPYLEQDGLSDSNGQPFEDAQGPDSRVDHETSPVSVLGQNAFISSPVIPLSSTGGTRLLDEVPETALAPIPANDSEMMPTKSATGSICPDGAMFEAAEQTAFEDAAPVIGSDAKTHRNALPTDESKLIPAECATLSTKDRKLNGVGNSAPQEVEEPPLDSDDADFLSASQLENELNSSAEEEPIQESIEDHAESLDVAATPGTRHIGSGELQSSQSWLPRPPSSPTKERQRKPQDSPTRSESPPQSNAEPEILDCITVDTEGSQSWSSPASASTSTETHVSMRKKGWPRGRKRKICGESKSGRIEVQISPRKKSKISSRCNEVRTSVEYQEDTQESSLSQEKENEALGTSVELDEDDDAFATPETSTSNTRHGISMSDIAENPNSQIATKNPVENALPRPDPRSMTQSRTTEAVVLTDLQSILGNLRSSRLSMAGLRSIEDILFQIRVEAQNSAQKC